MKKFLFALILMSSLIFTNAQTACTFESFKGFHLGVVGQSDFIAKGKITPLIGNETAPKSYWTVGGEIGIELSYHFAKYFGIAAGIRWGTGTNYKESAYLGSVPDIYGNVRDINSYSFPINYYESELYIPINLEFHLPLCNNFFLMAELGGTITGFYQRANYKLGQNSYTIDNCDNSYVHAIADNTKLNIQTASTTKIYENTLSRSHGNIVYEMIAGVGMYYKLPFGDLLRLSIGYNAAFCNTFEGNYTYFLSNSSGKCEIRHNHIFTQLGYIHTFVSEKKSHCLKKQNQ